MKKGFTLAEVLITLGIIGVVAALTIPALTHAYRKKLIESRLTSTSSLLNQALKLAEAEQGVITPYMELDTSTLVENYFIPYLKVSNPVKPNSNQSNGHNYQLANGVEVQYNIFGHNGGRLGLITVDLNITNQNLNGIDDFVFAIVNYDGKTKISGAENYDPARFNCDTVNNDSRAQIIDFCARGRNGTISNDDGAGRGYVYCTALIECNGWKIPNDYPIKY